MTEEPLFDPSLKKRKKKNVVFIEDPLGADADPTKPAPETIDSTTINGEAVDLGPSTAHELMKSNKQKEEEDFKAMFGDMKKKKKKKEIPMDFVRLLDSFIEPIIILLFLQYTQGDDSGPSESAISLPAEIAPAATEGTTTIDDLDFSDMKKKKKSNKKKANFDLEAFEKELNVSKAKSASKPEGGEEDEEDGPEPDGSHLDNIDETELGDDPFAQTGDAPVGVDAGNEAWLKSDRDYTYQEVRVVFVVQTSLLTHYIGGLAVNTVLCVFACSKSFSPLKCI
jgi:translation initiation factor 2 subunit 2